MARKPGLFTSGEREAVLFVGPMAPAAKRGFSGSVSVNLTAAAAAIRAEALFIS